jgi:hypothetical protein
MFSFESITVVHFCLTYFFVIFRLIFRSRLAPALTEQDLFGVIRCNRLTTGQTVKTDFAGTRKS